MININFSAITALLGLITIIVLLSPQTEARYLQAAPSQLQHQTPYVAPLMQATPSSSSSNELADMDEDDDDDGDMRGLINGASGNNQAVLASAGSAYQPQTTSGTVDLKAAASHHHHGHHAKGWLDMGAWTGKKGAFGWYDKHPVGKGK